MRAALISFCCISCCLMCGWMNLRPGDKVTAQPETELGLQTAITSFRAEAPQFSYACQQLDSAIRTLRNTTPAALALARRQLVGCRKHYKRIEYFLEYFFRNSAHVYNSPPKFEGEAPYLEYQEPIGLQVIESLLYERHPEKHIGELLQQTAVIASSASDLLSLLYDFKADDRQIMESLRLELIRIITLGITGYDAPSLKTGIAESTEALLSIQNQLQPYLRKGDLRTDSLRTALIKAIDCLQTAPAFDAFDRLGFLRRYAIPLQHQLGAFIREQKLNLNTTGILNYEADHLFSPDLWQPGKFPDTSGMAPGSRLSGEQLSTGQPGEPLSTGQQKGAETAPLQSLIILGRQLFNNTALSGNGKRSCASCHDPGKAFTDRLRVSLALDGHSGLQRNAPSLLYSAFQHSQFWDGRASSLEDQIRTVVHDPLEMGGNDSLIFTRLHLTCDSVASAIAAYIGSLRPMNSAFDRYMQGNEQALNAREKHGGNLFLGKGQCGTCHFMPLFNGLIPPEFQYTEFEVLGTTTTDDLVHPRLSPDPGRYRPSPLPFNRRAFKTPTVRNAAITYPYMHNGSFHNLEKVLEFYNKGGGAGLGLKVPEQTLPATPLGLSRTEIDDIILFIHALTDSAYALH